MGSAGGVAGKAGTAGLILGALLLASPVAAATCQDLSGEALRIQAMVDGSRGARTRYEAAFQEQLTVLDDARADAEDQGCLGDRSFYDQRRPASICGPLVARIGRMEANLVTLDRLRRGQSTGDLKARLRGLQSALYNQGCDMDGPGGRTGGGNEDDERSAPLHASQEQGIPPDPARDPLASSSRISGPMSLAGNTFRTLCVRGCDGYYFPISFSTTRDRFADDEATCQSLCPGADAALYVYANPGQDVKDMVSLDGKPYGDLKAAFAYRKQLKATCTCKAASTTRSYSVISTEPGTSSGPQSSPAGSLPDAAKKAATNPAPAGDDATVRAADAGPAASTAPASSASTIRSVGPRYWGGQSQVKVPLAPALKQDR
ncbi:Protein of unknown function [Faunimonas pinastri]|uniref:DUF2865 domain-containing protein n=1 Tax=Faunimonas pinastri TaxID=1855383 RepID=A0A1H9JBB4_9HYPH|nr:DUF2865 domain-containing protein [Faunimonas pinastri]SEQ84102.1 Protein of unknown function [Faunimonas pinastri]